MAVYIYKRLVDVKILNEYYLFNSDETSFFDISDASLRAQFLENRLLNGQYNLLKDLVIEPVGDSRRIMQDHKVRLVPLNSGFMLGMEVDESPQADGSLEYKPFIPLSRPLRLAFAIRLKNPLFLSFSGVPLRARMPAIYYFSNDAGWGVPAFPSLSLPMPGFAAGRTYEMGDLALINGQLREAIRRTDSSAQADWRAVPGDGYANDNDRALLPHRFAYSFGPGAAVTSAEFTLKDSAGEEVKKITFNPGGALSRVALDFTFKAPSGGNPPEAIPSGTYQLEISGDNNYSDSKKIILDDILYDRAYLGIVEIKIDKGSGPDALLRDNGSLITRRLADGSKISHPSYEIRIRSRITYWRYISNKKRELNVGPRASPYLTKEGRVLVSNDPRSLSAIPTIFSRENQNTGLIETTFLPNPTPSPISEQGGRIFSDIYVSQVKDAIIENT